MPPIIALLEFLAEDILHGIAFLDGARPDHPLHADQIQRQRLLGVVVGIDQVAVNPPLQPAHVDRAGSEITDVELVVVHRDPSYLTRQMRPPSPSRREANLHHEWLFA